MPEDHACYQCLLVGCDDQLMATMKDLALKRRAMCFALQKGLRGNREDLAKSLGRCCATQADNLDTDL